MPNRSELRRLVFLGWLVVHGSLPAHGGRARPAGRARCQGRQQQLAPRRARQPPAPARLQGEQGPGPPLRRGRLPGVQPLPARADRAGEEVPRPRSVQFLAVYPNERRRPRPASPATPTTATCPSRSSRTSARSWPTRWASPACPPSPSSTAISRCATAAGSMTATAPAPAGPRRRATTSPRPLDEVLAGKKVSVPETEADGCLLDRAAEGREGPAKVTFTQARRPDPPGPLPGVPPPRPGRAVLAGELRRRRQARPHDQGSDRRSGACRPGTPTRATASSATTAA